MLSIVSAGRCCTDQDDDDWYLKNFLRPRAFDAPARLALMVGRGGYPRCREWTMCDAWCLQLPTLLPCNNNISSNNLKYKVRKVVFVLDSIMPVSYVLT